MVQLIAEIASQTTCFAPWNATIEARRAPARRARASPWWRSEVKALATQTARATSEIGRQIDGSRDRDLAAVAQVEAVGGTLDTVAGGFSRACIPWPIVQQTAADPGNRPQCREGVVRRCCGSPN